jgi:hypothetical protein
LNVKQDKVIDALKVVMQQEKNSECQAMAVISLGLLGCVEVFPNLLEMLQYAKNDNGETNTYIRRLVGRALHQLVEQSPQE